MMRQAWVSLAIIVVVLFGFSAAGHSDQAVAQESMCPTIVRNAIAVTEDLCDGIERNQACYGHTSMLAEPQPDIINFAFDTEGDVEYIDQIRTLRLSLMDVDNGEWGVGLLRLQASYRQSQPETNVTMVLFGGVELDNQMTNEPTVEAMVNTTGEVNVRLGPSTNDRVIGSVKPGKMVTVTGRSADGQWVRIVLPATGTTGWIASWLLYSDQGFDALDVKDAGAEYYGPMQAFTFNSGSHDTLCAESPGSGLLIQTPEGAARVTLLINEVDVQVGSTVFFQAQPSDEMAIWVIEGSARVAVDDVVHVVPTGMMLTVPMDQDLKPSGRPTAPAVFDPADPVLQALPLTLLPELVYVVGVSPEVLAAFMGTESTSSAAPVNTTVVVDPVTGESVVVDADTGAPVTITVDETPEPGETPTPEPTDPPPPDPPACAAPKVEVCHNGSTICIAQSAVSAHLNHGDTMGACP